MKTIRFTFIFLLALVFFAVSANAQKTKKPVKRTTKPPATTITNADLKAGKEKVSNQISNVTRFTDILGPIAASIESIDKESKTKKLKKTEIDQNEANKRKVLEAIRNLRTGLTALETEFRTKPALRKYLPNIEGITVLSAQSENAALAGKFTESRMPLLTVLQKLSDTFAAMP